jgi:hypothetical protein
LEQHHDDNIATKQRLGAFLGADLDDYLRQRGATQVVLTGVATSSGVESTPRSAYDLGYNVTLVVDAMTDRDAHAHRHSVVRGSVSPPSVRPPLKLGPTANVIGTIFRAGFFETANPRAVALAGIAWPMSAPEPERSHSRTPFFGCAAGVSQTRIHPQTSGRDANRQRSQTGEPCTFEETEIENDFQKQCRKGAKFAAHTAFSAILGEISCLFSLALECFTAFEADRFNHSRTSPQQNSRQLSAVSRQQSSLRSEGWSTTNGDL